MSLDRSMQCRECLAIGDGRSFSYSETLCDNCSPVEQSVPPELSDRDTAALRLGQMLMWLDDNVADLTIMKTGGQKFSALIMDHRPSIAMSATSMSDLLAGTAAELVLEKRAGKR